MAHLTTIRVRFAELDPYSHVNHAAYVTYFEVARSEALDSVGMDLAYLLAEGVQFVITDISVKYRGAAEMGDVLTISTEMVETRRVSSTWGQVIRRGDQILAEATVRAGITDRNGKPTRPPAWLWERLVPLRVGPGGTETGES